MVGIILLILLCLYVRSKTFPKVSQVLQNQAWLGLYHVTRKRLHRLLTRPLVYLLFLRTSCSPWESSISMIAGVDNMVLHRIAAIKNPADLMIYKTVATLPNYFNNSAFCSVTL